MSIPPPAISESEARDCSSIKHLFLWSGVGYNAARGLISRKITIPFCHLLQTKILLCIDWQLRFLQFSISCKSEKGVNYCRCHNGRAITILKAIEKRTQELMYKLIQLMYCFRISYRMSLKKEPLRIYRQAGSYFLNLFLNSKLHTTYIHGIS